MIRININAKILVSQWFRTLGCPPAVGPAKQSKILGPFRRGVSRFRRFAFRVSLSRFRYTQNLPWNIWKKAAYNEGDDFKFNSIEPHRNSPFEIYPNKCHFKKLKTCNKLPLCQQNCFDIAGPASIAFRSCYVLAIQTTLEGQDRRAIRSTQRVTSNHWVN